MDEPKFVHIDKDFHESKYIIKLVDGCHTAGLIHAKGDAKIFLEDDRDNIHKAI